MENRELLKQILQLPLRKWIVTKYGTFEDIHKTSIAWFYESEEMQQMYLHILKFYKDFKTKK
jgi:hypothetical protein